MSKDKVDYYVSCRYLEALPITSINGHTDYTLTNWQWVSSLKSSFEGGSNYLEFVPDKYIKTTPKTTLIPFITQTCFCCTPIMFYYFYVYLADGIST